MSAAYNLRQRCTTTTPAAFICDIEGRNPALDFRRHGAVLARVEIALVGIAAGPQLVFGEDRVPVQSIEKRAQSNGGVFRNRFDASAGA